MPNPADFTTFTTPNPHYGSGGRPFTVLAIGGAPHAEESYWTAAEALDARDRLLDAGYLQVRVLGLPSTAVGVFPAAD